ncbi:MAG: cytochrome-c peroxidase [Crocinitomicaceae bacterium]|nr:cytochrome-c peroxidase [Crocinitomicaceae bacterium]
MKYIFISFLIIATLFSCKKDNVGYEPVPYVLDIPSHFPDMIIPADNPMTIEGVALGRKLFYEKQLSGDNTQACADCHSPQNAFSDPEQFSTGIDGLEGNRNSMALINLGWQNFFFWDGRAATLEEQILQPVINPIEMHETWPNAVAKLYTSQEYRNMFYQAFGETGIDSVKVSKAVAQFLRTMISGNSKYDVMYKDKYNLPLTAEELIVLSTVTPAEDAGYDIFEAQDGADCLHCHKGYSMQIQGFSNNGMDATFTDNGRGDVTGNPLDNGKFKIPTIRNIAYSAPYMHDGRFATLEEVINHYSFGLVDSPTIDPLMEKINEGGADLDQQQIDFLLQFLNTLSDESFINNPDFQEPQ